MTPYGTRDYHRERAMGLEKNAWARVGGDPMNAEAPYLQPMDVRQLLMQNAILHATLALTAPTDKD